MDMTVLLHYQLGGKCSKYETCAKLHRFQFHNLYIAHGSTSLTMNPEASSMMQALSGAHCTDARLYTL